MTPDERALLHAQERHDAELEAESVHIYYRDDADGFAAPFAGQRATREPMPRAEAEDIRRACPNGSQMEVRPMTRMPEVTLAEDCRHVLWSHECNFEYLDSGSNWHPEVMLPLHDQRGWRVESADPLTVSPSILCGSCGTHGFWRNGAWVSA